MTHDGLRKFSAVALFFTTIATVAMMWLPDFRATAVAELPVFCLAALWLIVDLLNRRDRSRLHRILIPMLLVTAWPMLQILAGTTIYKWNTTVAVLYWAAGTAIVFVGVRLFRDSTLRQAYLRALVMVGFVTAVIAPLQLYTSGDKVFWLFETKYASSPMGPFVYANQYAAFIELLLPIAMAGVVSGRSGWKAVHGVAAVVMYASVLASASRTGFTLATLEVIVVPMITARRLKIPQRRLAVPAAIFLAVLVLVGLAAGPERLVEKLQQKNPYSGRLEFVESSLRMIPERPFFGVGLNNWSVAYPAYATFDDGLFANQAHNDWVQWTVEGGFPFVILMLSIAVWSARAGIRTGWGLGVAVVFFQCFFDYPIQRMGVAVVFFSLMAALASPDERRIYGSAANSE